MPSDVLTVRCLYTSFVVDSEMVLTPPGIYFCPCVIPSLTSNQWNITKMLDCMLSHKIVMPISLEDSLSCWLWRQKLLYCKQAYGESQASNWGRSLADNNQEMEILNPATWRQLKDANNHMSLEAYTLTITRVSNNHKSLKGDTLSPCPS